MKKYHPTFFAIVMGFLYVYMGHDPHPEYSIVPNSPLNNPLVQFGSGMIVGYVIYFWGWPLLGLILGIGVSKTFLKKD